MKILLVVHGWPLEKMGGVGLYVLSKAQKLQNLGHQVVVMAPQKGPINKIVYQQESWGKAWIVESPSPKRWKEIWSKPKQRVVLETAIGQWQPNVIHIHHLDGFDMDFSIARRTNALLVITLHDYALICSRGQLYSLEHGLCSGPTPEKCAACISAHFRLNPISSWIGERLKRYPGFRSALRKKLDTSPPPRKGKYEIAKRLTQVRRLLHQMDVVLTPSIDLQRRFIEAGFIKASHVDLPLLSKITPLRSGRTSGETRFLFASTIIPTKGLHILLKALSNLSTNRYRLSIAGHAPVFDGWPNYVEECKSLVRECEQITWIGAVPHEQMPALLSEHDVLVLPSLWPENSPIVVREALAAGLKVICSINGGAKELSNSIITVDNGNVEDLEKVLLQLITQKPSTVAEDFNTMQQHVQKTIDLYRCKIAEKL